MTTKTALTYEEIRKIWLETADIIPHCDHHVHFARAIEQAMLQSPGVQALWEALKQCRLALEPYDKLYKALYDLINDLNSRSEDGVVNCSNWVYQQALSALESDI